MGLERLLFPVSGFCSRKPPLCNIQHSVRLFKKACLSTQSSPGIESGPTGFSVLCRRIFSCTKPLPSRRGHSSSSSQPSIDVTLFQHDKTRFARLLSLFCGGQFLFWSYLAHFAFTGLRNTDGRADRDKNKASTPVTGLAGMWSFEMNLGSNAWRYSFTLGCLAIGSSIVSLGILFCRRSVSKVVLHQGGKMVTLCTQSPLGPHRGHKITVPLSQVACYTHRHESPSFIPLKVKGHRMFFILDKEGTLNNARLFDVTVGAYRSL